MSDTENKSKRSPAQTVHMSDPVRFGKVRKVFAKRGGDLNLHAMMRVVIDEWLMAQSK